MVDKSFGFRRRVDPMRRVTLPRDLAEKYNIRVGDQVEISDGAGCIVVKTCAKRCVFCGREEDVVAVRDGHICLDCLKVARHETKSKTAKFAAAHLKVIR